MAALTSPGVAVTIIDESQYTQTAAGTVAYVLVASAQDKLNTTGSLATYTTKANAGKVFTISSQRELVQYFGIPTFQVDAADNSLHGDERNEYGLLAAYSALGVGNRVLIQRADIDLDQLVGTGIRPTGTPNNGAYWLDLDNTNYGVYEWNSELGFLFQNATAITDASMLDGSTPLNSVGSIGDYAIVSTSTSNPIYYKRYDNSWTAVGSEDWQVANPVVVGTAIIPANLHIGQSLRINSTNVTITGTTVDDAIQDINGAVIQGVIATATSLGQLELRIDATSASSGNVQLADGKMTIELGIDGPDAARELGVLTSTETSVTVFAPAVQYGSYINAPAWRSTDLEPRADGSIWLKTSAKGNGANWGLKKYNSSIDTWQLVSAPLFIDDESAILSLDFVGGGSQLPIGTTYIKYDTLNINGTENAQLTFKPYIKQVVGILKITGSIPVTPFVFIVPSSFGMTVSVPGTVNQSATIIISGTTSSHFVESIQSANLPNISAFIESTGAISISHLAGGTIRFDYIVGTPLAIAGFTSGTQVGCASHIQLLATNSSYLASPFEPLVYAPSYIAPYSYATDGTLWYNSDATDVDIMIHNGNDWKGYLTVSNDARGYNLSDTNPTGVMISPTQPILQTDDSSLVPGDLWLDSGDLENYPRIYRYDGTGWGLIDNTDDTSSDGIIFADARWASSDTVDPVIDGFPSITTLLESDYLDSDAPNYQLYPRGSLLFNTRRSGFNVKRFESTWHANADVVPTIVSSWVSQSGVDVNNVPYFGHKAQRNTVVEAMSAAIGASTVLREEQIDFNLLCCPGYPELMQEMVVLNNDRKQTAFIIGDTPLGLNSSSQSLMSWGSNSALSNNNSSGLVTRDTYLGVYYPSGYTTDLRGNGIVVPSSHMMLRTMIRSDNQSYPWFAPAGVRRGLVDNVTAIGYVDTTNDNMFISIGLTNSLRDILYEKAINPITVLPGSGIVAYGQKSCTTVTTAMDRINVARLVCYLRVVLDAIARPYMFEPNDTITRNQVKQAFEQVLNDLVAKRGITDYLVVCDDTNNTSDRIARNELWIDIAIEPTRAIEFIYIPVRLKNPGTIAGA
jgi:hypothetical protein